MRHYLANITVKCQTTASELRSTNLLRHTVSSVVQWKEQFIIRCHVFPFFMVKTHPVTSLLTQIPPSHALSGRIWFNPRVFLSCFTAEEKNVKNAVLSTVEQLGIDSCIRFVGVFSVTQTILIILSSYKPQIKNKYGFGFCFICKEVVLKGEK